METVLKLRRLAEEYNPKYTIMVANDLTGIIIKVVQPFKGRMASRHYLIDPSLIDKFRFSDTLCLDLFKRLESELTEFMEKGPVSL